MKTIFKLIVLLLLLSSEAIAQTPQPIHSFARVLHSVDWYKQQQKLWKAEIEKNNSNAEAWYFYFKASRVLTRVDENDKRTQKEKETLLKQIVADMEKAVPNTFEYNHAVWISAGLGDMSKITYLQKAAELQPDNALLCSDMINLGEINRDMAMRDKYAKLWFTSGETSAGMLYYNYNVMAGLKENAILVTVGDNDTYPIWVLQASMGFRKDITAINTSLILVKEYREKLFKELGVPALTYDPFESEETLKKFNTEILTLLASNKSKRPVYLALTGSNSCEGSLLQDNAANLYLTGLAYEYSTTPIDNIALLKKNFEQAYALDYLDKYFVQDMSVDIVKHLNTNYTVPMVKLYEHYVLAGETQKAEKIKNQTLKLVEGTDDEAEVKKIFKK
jgi:hypothetical protein